jgi:hypothetical protein
MKKASLLIPVAALSVIMLLGACSSDKNTNPAKTPGSENDVDYQTAQALAREIVDSLPIFAVDGYSYMNFDSIEYPKILSDTGYVDFDSTTKWWVFYFHHDSTYSNLTAMDSVRFEEGDSCTIFPDSLHTTGIDYRGTLELSVGSDTVNVGADLGNRLHITGIQAEQIIFNGLATGDLSWQLGLNRSIQCTYSGTETNVTFNRFDLENGPNPHPVDGSISMSMAVNQVAPQGSSQVSWTLDITFYMDHYHIHFESGDNYWDWDGPYGA